MAPTFGSGGPSAYSDRVSGLGLRGRNKAPPPLPVLARAGNREYILGPAGGAPAATGWGEDCWTGPPIPSPPGNAPTPAPESLLRRDHAHAHEACSDRSACRHLVSRVLRALRHPERLAGLEISHSLRLMRHDPTPVPNRGRSMERSGTSLAGWYGATQDSP